MLWGKVALGYIRTKSSFWEKMLQEKDWNVNRHLETNIILHKKTLIFWGKSGTIWRVKSLKKREKVIMLQNMYILDCHEHNSVMSLTVPLLLFCTLTEFTQFCILKGT